MCNTSLNALSYWLVQTQNWSRTFIFVSSGNSVVYKYYFHAEKM